ncbi:MAG TPA: type I methionyl aminopeptidase [Spirochaetota bacterium]|nr:type I methionyl aminopeptidase [Spirochaetota bacterium]
MAIYIYNEDEIKRVEDACRITAAVLEELGKNVVEGISTFELDRVARDLIRKSNAIPAFLGYKGYPAAICTSVNEVVVHGIPHRNQILRKGDIVGIDIGVKFKDFFGDTAKTFIVGKVNNKVKKLLEVTKEALELGILQCKDGNHLTDISHVIESHVVQWGFQPVHEFVGHGIGRNMHEEPSIPNFGKPGKGPIIKTGMIFAIEPMINEGTYQVEILDDGWTTVTKDRKNSAHFEHTVAVVHGSPKILTMV